MRNHQTRTTNRKRGTRTQLGKAARRPQQTAEAPQAEAAHHQQLADLDAVVMTVAADLIDPNPYQPRRFFDASELQVLAESIELDGLVHRPVCRPVGERYQLLAGERRLRAMRDVLGWAEIKVEVRELSEQDMRRMTIAENVARADLTAWEWAHAVAACRTLVVAEADGGMSEHALIVRVCEEMAALGRKLGARQVRKYLRVADTLTPELVDSHGGPEAVCSLGIETLDGLVTEAIAKSLESQRTRARPRPAAEERAVEKAERQAKRREKAIKRALDLFRGVAPDCRYVFGSVPDDGTTRGVVLVISDHPENVSGSEARALREILAKLTKAVRKAERRASREEIGG